MLLNNLSRLLFSCKHHYPLCYHTHCHCHRHSHSHTAITLTPLTTISESITTVTTAITTIAIVTMLSPLPLQALPLIITTVATRYHHDCSHYHYCNSSPPSSSLSSLRPRQMTLWHLIIKLLPPPLLEFL